MWARERPERAAGSRYGSRAARPSSPRARWAASRARSTPTRSAVAIRSWTSSRVRWSSGAEVSAVCRRMRPVAPCSSTTTCAAVRLPWAMAAAWRSPRLAQASSRTASLTWSSASSKGVPAGSRTTSRASSRAPATPTAASSGTRAPLRAARSSTRASCSTCWPRRSDTVGPASLYQTNRQSLAKRRASVLSRPTTSTARRSSSSLTKVVRPQGWTGSRRRPSASTPSSRSDDATCPAEGVPPGDPNARWAAAAHPQPRARVANTDTGRPSARYTAAKPDTQNTVSTIRRVGRVR